MDDLRNTSIFMLIFAGTIVAYGLLLLAHPSKNLLPMRAAQSVKNEDDIRRVGRITAIIGVAIGAIAGAILIL